MVKYKTKLTGESRRHVVAQGRVAARRGWERKSPYTKCRAEEAWLAGFDDVNTPSSLVHCTVCGVMHSDENKCPTCGDTSSQRTGIGVGETIYMTQ